MQFISLTSNNTDERNVALEFKQQLNTTSISSLICYYTEEYCSELLSRYLVEAFPNIPIQGCSSCQGIMTEKGYHSGPVVGILAISDSGINAYGTGLSHYSDDRNNIDSAIDQALDEAMLSADRFGEVPSLIILHATPGDEERMIACIDKKFGTLVAIIGGSAADDKIDGKWSIFNEKSHCHSGVSVTLIYSSQSIFTSFSAGHSATEYQGTITKARGRELLEIDHKPALEVYHYWTDHHLGNLTSDGYLFDKATIYPLGRIAGYIYEQPYYKLSHPIRETPSQGIELFTSIQEGEKIYLMVGNKTHLIGRAARVVNSAYNQKLEDMERLGGINIFCAGPMLHLRQDIDAVCDQINTALDGKPFICPFTFGEQGRFIGGENGHGNLMISSAVFHKVTG
ncbi:FIST signal transduction protein [Vibrio genomosp. F6]|uniref:Histidine kinase n=1 Tax=Vibrio genomosp. F6 str. FF-238 TaxID=1191298 RepID=A0A1E5CL97_9VIBR|nr:FIST N-terminal domain-containing protein [Vibrio genomosp. F6]OEE69476.1 histidine kinase [Vibrio genomosp. F6 str. FF-238]